MDRQTQDRPIEARRATKWWRMASVIVVALTFGVLMRATLLWAAPAEMLAAATPAQSAPDHGGEGGHEGDYVITFGVLITRPLEKIGTWVISDTQPISFTATSSTVVEGELQPGACVAVKSSQSAPETALMIFEQDRHKCDDNDGGDDGGDDHEEYAVTFGVLISRPVETIGTWVISDSVPVTFTAVATTEVEGELQLDDCVAIKTLDSAPSIAVKILEQDGHKCGDDDGDDDGGDDHDNGRRVLFGPIRQLPADLYNGEWLVAGLSFVSTPQTEIVTKGVTLEVGMIVKVQFATENGIRYAQRIEFKFGHNNPCRDFDTTTLSIGHNGGDDGRGGDDHGNGRGHDDDGDEDRWDDDWDHHRFYGYCPGYEGKAIGIIEDRPDGTLIGDWVIGGMPYSVTAFTEFKGSDDFLPGERVKVEYVVLSDTLRLAIQIKAEDGSGGLDPNLSLNVGNVVTKPAAFIGWWNIDGALFEADASTVFVERGTVFAEGSYVVVEYEITGDRRLIRRITTYVMPGGGDENVVGQLQAVGGVTVAGTESALQANAVWTIDGVDYTVSEATQLLDDTFEPGMTVSVNSYTYEGQRYATQIRAQSGKLFIPMTVR